MQVQKKKKMNYLKCLEKESESECGSDDCLLCVCLFVFLFVVVVVVLIMISCHFTPLLQCVNTSCMGAIQQWREWLEKFHRCYIFFYHIWVLTWVGFFTLCRGQTGREGWWEIRKGGRRSGEIAQVVSTAGGPRLAGAMCPSTSEAQWPPLNM